MEPTLTHEIALKGLQTHLDSKEGEKNIAHISQSGGRARVYFMSDYLVSHAGRPRYRLDEYRPRHDVKWGWFHTFGSHPISGVYTLWTEHHGEVEISPEETIIKN